MSKNWSKIWKKKMLKFKTHLKIMKNLWKFTQNMKKKVENHRNSDKNLIDTVKLSWIVKKIVYYRQKFGKNLIKMCKTCGKFFKKYGKL